MASATILWALPSANATSGGGCTKTSGQGFTIASCISEHGENRESIKIIPDYIDAVPNLQNKAWRIAWPLIKEEGRRPGLDGSGACVPGHVILQPPNDLDNYYLELQVVTHTGPATDNSVWQAILQIDSPVQFY
jgi:hypothetical protein